METKIQIEKELYIGTLQKEDKQTLVRLDRPDRLVGQALPIPSKYIHGAPLGMKVTARLIAKPYADGSGALGEIVEVLGDPDRPDVAILGIIREYGLGDKFPPAVQTAADSFEINPSAEEIEAELKRGRRDLRQNRTITIDGEDAKDLDDAIDIEFLPTSGGYKLGVHIADVTHYVREGSPLDKEAAKRGNSVYLVDRVLPMLPPKLSNGLCSLNPESDRLALSVLLEFDMSGRLLRGELLESVIRSKARTSYDEVKKTLETGSVLTEREEWLLADLKIMKELAEKLALLRRQRGAINFEFPETIVELDPTGKPLDIYAYPVSFANEIIESFMIAANEFVAEQALTAKLPFSYRVHELPDADKLANFIRMAKIYNIPLKLKNKPNSGDLAAALEKIKNEPFGQTLSQLLLRSLAKARYDSKNLGHFGLASKDYCHFTAPIRRYSDLFNHRVLKAHLHNSVPFSRWRRSAIELNEHCSETERLSMQAERDSVDQKAVEYMCERLGMHFKGIISGFNPAGFYVQLENTVEGMVPFRSLDGYYDYLEEELCAINYQSGDKLQLGDAVEIQVAHADVTRRLTDFLLIDHQTAKSLNDQAGEKKNKNSYKRGRPAKKGQTQKNQTKNNSKQNKQTQKGQTKRSRNKSKGVKRKNKRKNKPS